MIDFFDLGTVEQVVEETFIKETKRKEEKNSNSFSLRLP